MTALVAAVTTTARNSDSIQGSELLRPRQAASAAVPAAQVVYTGGASGNFEVELQGRFNIGTDSEWGEVATIDQDSVNNPVTFPFSARMEYRFHHVSGANVTCILG